MLMTNRYKSRNLTAQPETDVINIVDVPNATEKCM